MILCCTSLGFGCVAVYGLIKRRYLLSATSLVTSAASVTYWAKECPGCFRHKVDGVVSKVSFAIYTLHGILYVKSHWAWPCWFAVVASFWLSKHLRKRRRDRLWVVAHAAFHVFVSAGQMLVVSSVVSPGAVSVPACLWRIVPDAVPSRG